MAEFALGLTKTAVEGTLSLVKSAIEEENKLREKVQNDLVFITGEFEVMQSFLHVANREHTANDKVALTLVRQLRTLAFDVEDCVEYVVHLDLDKSSRWGWLRRLWQTVNCRAPPLPLDVAVAEIKQLKARVEDVSQRNTRYSLILHDSNNKQQKQLGTVMPLPAEEPLYATTTTYLSMAFHDLCGAWKATGKWSSNMCNLQQELLIAPEGEDDHDLRVISVWGSTSARGGGGGAAAGPGMASIFTKVYCDPEICKNFKIRAWVKLMHPFNHDEFVKSLLAQFYASSSHQANSAGVDFFAWMKAEVTEADKLMKANNLMQQMREQRYLLVLEDVLTVAEWHMIRMYLPDSKNNSRILLLTPQLGIALLCTGEPYQVSELGNLSDDKQFLCAFSKKEKEYCRILSSQTRYQEVIQWVETHQPVGRDREVKLLGELFLYNRSLLSVWGIPGVGKSTVVRTVYCKEILRSLGPESSSLAIAPPEAFAWVDVPSPFNLTEFAWCLFLDFYSDYPQAKETAIVSMMKEGRQVPILECCKILHMRSCLVVMDGLCSKQDWDLIKTTFLAEPTFTKIVVIANEEEVAMHCVENNKEKVMNITRLEANAALSLLVKIAYGDEQLTCENMEQVKSIVAKCGGLPKVITSVCEWTGSYDDISGNFMRGLETEPGLRPLFSWMKSYFDACPDSIKPCIFYLSIFDAENNIRLRRLLWRWIAEGYCRDTSDGRTCEDNGKNYISELVKLSIIQGSARSNTVLCQINGFFQEYIISRPMEDNLVFALEKGCSLNSQRAGQHLTIRRSWNRRDKIVFESIDFSRLRSLTVFGKWESFFISRKNVNMRLLRVLDLEDAEGVTNEDLEQIAKLLTRLKFLSIRGHTKINCLPIPMAGLRQLQTLDIRGTSIVMLPLFITKLQKLRYIRAGTTTCEAWDWEGGHVILTVEADSAEDMASSSAQGVTNLPSPAAATDTTAPVLQPDAVGTPNKLVSSLLSKMCRSGGWLDNNGAAAGVKVPAGIQKLALLHTLGVVNVNVTSSAKSIFFEELKNLTQLHKLGVSGINKGNIKEFFEAISDHAHLKSLSVELDKDDNLDGLDDIPKPPNTLHSLKLYGQVNKLLVWIRQLRNNLKKLKLDLTIEKPEELQALAFKIEGVVGHVRIRPIQGGSLYFRGIGWAFARVVEIQCSSILHTIKFDNHIWWHVEVLKVHFSEESQSSLQIFGLDWLWNLKEVWLKDYTEVHKQDMQRQINEMERPQKPVLKLVQKCSS